MRVIFIIIFYFLQTIFLSAQSNPKIIIEGNLKKLQGIWQALKYSNKNDDLIPIPFFYLIKNDTCFELSKNGIAGSHYLIFLSNKYISDLDDLNKEDINNASGTYFSDDIYCYEMTIDKDTLTLYNPQGKQGGTSIYRKIKHIVQYKNITTTKSPVFSSPNIPTKMYLVKLDEVEVIGEKDNWLHIKYYGKKIVEGWIRKKDTIMQ